MDNPQNLIDKASEYLIEKYSTGRHHVACGLATDRGTFLSLHLDSYGHDVCAEPIALSNAMAKGAERFDLLACVKWDGDTNNNPYVVAPCGDCRQLLVQYTPSVLVAVPTEGAKVELIKATSLIPWPYLKS